MPDPRSPAVTSMRAAPRYSATAQTFHWLTVLAILVTVPIAKIMTDRGEAGIWDATTNALYSSHKLIGILVLLLIVLRLSYRLKHGAPPDAPALTAFQRTASHAVHWGMYALLLLVPLGGWIGVSLYGARDIFGLFSLPQITPENKDLAAQVFTVHKIAAFTIVALVAVHLTANVYHAIRGDGVLRRMLPGSKSDV